MMDGLRAIDVGLFELLHYIHLCIRADTPTIIVIVIIRVKQLITSCSSQLLKEDL